MTRAFGERTRRFGYRWALPLAIAIACSAIADEAVDRSDWLNQQNSAKVADDAHLVAVEPNNSIVLITVGPKSSDALTALGFSGGFNRRTLAAAVWRMRESGARSVLVDYALTKPAPANDPILADALTHAAPMTITLARGEPRVEPGTNSEPDGVACSFPQISPQLERVAGVYKGSAYLFETDSVVSGIALVRIDHTTEQPILHAALAASIQFQGGDPTQAIWDHTAGRLRAGKVVRELSQGRILFVRPLKRGRRFATIAIEDIMRKSASLGGKLVVLASGDPDLDQHMVAGMDTISGGEFLACAVNTLLLPATVRTVDAPRAMLWAWWIALTFVAAAATLTRRALQAIAGTCAALVAAWAVPAALLQQHLRIEVVSTLSAIGLAFVTSVVAAYGLGQRSDFRPAGMQEEATTLFVDLIGSTEITARVGAQNYQQYHAALNAAIAAATRRHQGILERTTGDGALCIFRRGGRTSHAVRAVECGLELAALTDARVLRASARFGIDPKLSIGMESGTISGGYVTEGGGRHWSSTGSAVNAAQRLQTACSTLGLRVVLGPECANLVGERFLVRPIGDLELKGFAERVAAFTI